MSSKLFSGLLVLCLFATVASATPIINVGDHNLLPNTSGQVIEFSVSGGDLVIGLEFDIQVGDGGADIGGTDTGPVMTAIDLLSGTIFEGGTQGDVVEFPLARQSTVDVEETVTANGPIASVTFDTTGMFTGTYDLLLSGVAGSFNTTFYDEAGNPISTDVTNGTITIPEPTSMALLAFGGLALIRRRRVLA